MITFVSVGGHDRLLFTSLMSSMPHELPTAHFHGSCPPVEVLWDSRAVVVWNGLAYLSHKVAKEVTELSRPPQMIYMEHGYLPRTVQIDPQGVNGGAIYLLVTVEIPNSY